MFTQSLTVHNTADNTTRAALLLRLTYNEGSHTIKVSGYVCQVREHLFKVYVHSAHDDSSVCFSYASLTEARKEARAIMLIAAQAATKNMPNSI